ncbi:MAG TPA: hypothetical protein VEW72_02775, partial [Burkholderiales bacterium]|nr:hypothetical protein [Burkholderiales bacterium]
TLRRQEGYDHGYFFISTFMEDHLRHHAAHLTPVPLPPLAGGEGEGAVPWRVLFGHFVKHSNSQMQ